MLVLSNIWPRNRELPFMWSIYTAFCIPFSLQSNFWLPFFILEDDEHKILSYYQRDPSDY